MSDRRVVFISQISSGSKFRLVANRVGANHDSPAAKAKTQGTHWVSCLMNNPGGNFTRPFSGDEPFVPTQGYWMVFNPSVGWIRRYPAQFSVMNLPCPRRYNYHFEQRGGPGSTSVNSFSVIPDIFPKIKYQYKPGAQNWPEPGSLP